MAERLLTGAIQKDGKLTEGSISLLRASGIPFELPTGRQRFSGVEDPSMRIGTEKNGGLAYGVATGKYDWAIPGRDTVYALPDYLRRRIQIVEPDLGFGYCYYVAGVFISEYRPESTLLIDRSKTEMQGLEDLRPGTTIATKYEHALNRIIREQERRLKRQLHLEVVHEDTPETAPVFSFGDILVVADIWEHGDTFLENCIEPRITLFDSQAVLIRRAYRFSKGRERSFERLHEMIKEGLAHSDPLVQLPSSIQIQAMTDGHERFSSWFVQKLWPFPNRSKPPIAASQERVTLA